MVRRLEEEGDPCGKGSLLLELETEKVYYESGSPICELYMAACDKRPKVRSPFLPHPPVSRESVRWYHPASASIGKAATFLLWKESNW